MEQNGASNANSVGKSHVATRTKSASETKANHIKSNGLIPNLDGRRGRSRRPERVELTTVAQVNRLRRDNFAFNYN